MFDIGKNHHFLYRPFRGNLLRDCGKCIGSPDTAAATAGAYKAASCFDVTVRRDPLLNRDAASHHRFSVFPGNVTNSRARIFCTHKRPSGNLLMWPHPSEQI